MASDNATLLKGESWALKRDARTLQNYLVLERDGDKVDIPIDKGIAQNILEHAPYYNVE